MLKGRLTFKEAIESPAFSLMSRHRLKVAQRATRTPCRGMTPSAEKFRQQIQQEVGLTVGPKDPLLALWVMFFQIPTRQTESSANMSPPWRRTSLK
jgi:hypothetical protein